MDRKSTTATCSCEFNFRGSLKGCSAEEKSPPSRKRVYKQLTLLESFKSPSCGHDSKKSASWSSSKKGVQSSEDGVEIVDVDACYIGSVHKKDGKIDECNVNYIDGQPDLLEYFSSEMAVNELGGMKKPKLEFGGNQECFSKGYQSHRLSESDDLTSTFQMKMNHTVCKSPQPMQTEAVSTISLCMELCNEQEELSNNAVHEKSLPVRIDKRSAALGMEIPQGKTLIKRRRARYTYTRPKKRKRKASVMTCTKLQGKDANEIGQSIEGDEKNQFDRLLRPAKDKQRSCSKDGTNIAAREHLTPRGVSADEGFSKDSGRVLVESDNTDERISDKQVCSDKGLAVEDGQKVEERKRISKPKEESVEEEHYVMMSTPQEREARRLARLRQLNNMRSREMAELRKERALRRGGRDTIDGSKKSSDASKSKRVSWKDGELVCVFNYSPFPEGESTLEAAEMD